MILAIDTATSFAGLALYDSDTVWGEEIWYTNRNHTVELLPRLNRMLNTISVSVSKLECIVVSHGPGSYTGVRIAVAVAKGLALPHQIPLVGVSTLDITAYPHKNQPLPVYAMAQAGRKRHLIARYQWHDDVWIQTISPFLTTISDVVVHLTEPILIAGEITAKEANYLQEKLPDFVHVVNPIHRIRRPSILAEIGMTKLNNQSKSDNNLEPVYLNSP
ncbi:MAG: tRNA (adenosine(37)-N6)-threonylcarbamoyltransferase complex dimerization subunit type 1 TsaB [Anaerolineaceae bacterium 4572_78]|nr:MAG: tRNA (adenosine(37)-N6)-threonylcarbamoyltransferase complex dimerization subunit type 1 TsaB [Anaerolineaceae bacterium 4572_78]